MRFSLWILIWFVFTYFLCFSYSTTLNIFLLFFTFHFSTSTFSLLIFIYFPFPISDEFYKSFYLVLWFDLIISFFYFPQKLYLFFVNNNIYYLFSFFLTFLLYSPRNPTSIFLIIYTYPRFKFCSKYLKLHSISYYFYVWVV